jgi:hypothetical protein
MTTQHCASYSASYSLSSNKKNPVSLSTRGISALQDGLVPPAPEHLLERKNLRPMGALVKAT